MTELRPLREYVERDTAHVGGDADELEARAIAHLEALGALDGLEPGSTQRWLMTPAAAGRLLAGLRQTAKHDDLWRGDTMTEQDRPDPVYALAQAWAALDPLQRYVDQAPDGPTPVDDLVAEYLADHDPYPAGTRVTARGTGNEWEPATILDRTGRDEWTVEYDDGVTAWRGHTELRPEGETQ